MILNKHKYIINYYKTNMKKIIIYENQIFQLDIEPSESDEIIYERINFILKNKNKYDYNKLLILSKLYINKKIKDMEYDIDIDIDF
jgi:hypothetical protein